MTKNSRHLATLLLATAAALLALFLLSVFSDDAAGGSYYNETLANDEYKSYYLYGSTNDTFEISFHISQGEIADVYIMTGYEYNNNYKNNESFTPSFSRENRSSFTNDTWKQPDGQSYYLIVDNQDNSRESDALPTGNITYSIRYIETYSGAEKFFENICFGGMLMFGGCCALFIIVFIVILVLIFRKNDTNTVIIPSQQMYPQQQGYYQSPGQRQPSGYQQPPSYPGSGGYPPGQSQQRPPSQYQKQKEGELRPSDDQEYKYY